MTNRICNIEYKAEMFNRRAALVLVCAILLLLANGCGSGIAELTSGKPNLIPPAADLALASSPQFELFSLDPAQPEVDDEAHFQKWKVLGKTIIVDSTVRERIIAALRAGVPKYEQPPAACFFPRHGIRVADQGKTYDFVICFECHAVGVYTEGEATAGFQINSSPQPVLDSELTRAGIPLAKKPGR